MYKWEVHHQNLKKEEENLKRVEQEEVVDLRRAKLEVGVDAVLILLVLRYTVVINIPGEQVWRRKNG